MQDPKEAALLKMIHESLDRFRAYIRERDDLIYGGIPIPDHKEAATDARASTETRR